MAWITTAFSAITGLFKSGSSGGVNIGMIVLTIIVGILLFIIGLLASNVDKLKAEIITYKQQIVVLETSLEEQNTAIENSRADYKRIADEFGRLGNVLDQRYSNIVIKDGEKFVKAQCEDKLDMLKQSFDLFKIELNKEIANESGY